MTEDTATLTEGLAAWSVALGKVQSRGRGKIMTVMRSTRLGKVPDWWSAMAQFQGAALREYR